MRNSDITSHSCAKRAASLRAIAIGLALAALAGIAGACANAGNDPVRDRPPASNYSRLPIR